MTIYTRPVNLLYTNVWTLNTVRLHVKSNMDDEKLMRASPVHIFATT
jgi:hypothetical protein